MLASRCEQTKSTSYTSSQAKDLPSPPSKVKSLRDGSGNCISIIMEETRFLPVQSRMQNYEDEQSNALGGYITIATTTTKMILPPRQLELQFGRESRPLVHQSDESNLWTLLTYVAAAATMNELLLLLPVSSRALRPPSSSSSSSSSLLSTQQSTCFSAKSQPLH